MRLSNLIGRGKIKRSFRSRKKLSEPNLVSHITQRASGKEPLFVEEADFLYMLKLLKDISNKFQLRIFAFVLMTNHLHLLFQLTHENLSQAMHNLFTRYATYFNRKYERRGHLFGGPFRQSVCLDDTYLLVSSFYIHLNPVRAGMVKHYSQYRWSTWRLYCQDTKKTTFVDYRFILGILNQELQQARKEYSRKLEQAMEIEASSIYKNARALHIFRDTLIEKFPKIFTKLSIKTSFDGYAGDSELENIFSTLDGKKRIRNPTDKKARKFLVEHLLSRGFTKKEVALKLRISRQTLYKIFL